jgi:hypothetical protein
MRDCVLSVMRHQKYVKLSCFLCILKDFVVRHSSIAAIAHVEMKTKQDQEELGTQIIVEGSKFVSQDTYCRKVLHLRLKSLFNIPARRNFKSRIRWSTVILSMSFNVSFSAKYLFLIME